MLEQEINGANFGYIDKNKLLEYVTEEDIFELVFGFKPKEFDYVTSPFRQDTKPGCWFEKAPSGKLKFTDFGSKIIYKDRFLTNLDCFDAVKYYFKLNNMYQVLNFIKDKLILGKNLKKLPKREVIIKDQKDKKDFKITFNARNFLLIDKYFWQDKYGITKANLIEDKVFCIEKYATEGNKGKSLFIPETIAYAYTEFSSGHIKLYQPYNSKLKFITNCTPNDIGGLHKYDPSKKSLVITKSYKDWRVLVNLNINSIWIMSERVLPSLDYLLSFCLKHETITFFYDNDETGIIEMKKAINIVNAYFPNKAKGLVLPQRYLKEGITDPSDLYCKKGIQSLVIFLKNSNLLT